jgi:hypothetical protein
MKEEYQELKFAEWLEEKQQHELEKLVPPIGQYLGSIIEQKKGRVSWRKFSVTKEIYQQTIRKGLDNHIPTRKPSKEPLEYDPCSGASLKNNNNYDHIKIPENLVEIGFGNRHISQILEMGKLSEAELQDSLFHFSQDLQVGLKVRLKSTPLALFIGTLRNGSPYISEEFLNSLKADLEEVKARVQKYEGIQKELQENAIKARFIEWKEKNPDKVEQFKKEIIKENPMMAGSSRYIESVIFQKWEEIITPGNVRQTVLDSIPDKSSLNS